MSCSSTKGSGTGGVPDTCKNVLTIGVLRSTLWVPDTCGSFIYFSVLCLLCLCARLWPPAGKGLTSWFLSVVSNYEFVTFPLVSWVRCCT